MVRAGTTGAELKMAIAPYVISSHMVLLSWHHVMVQQPGQLRACDV